MAPPPPLLSGGRGRCYTPRYGEEANQESGRRAADQAEARQARSPPRQVTSLPVVVGSVSRVLQALHMTAQANTLRQIERNTRVSTPTPLSPVDQDAALRAAFQAGRRRGDWEGWQRGYQAGWEAAQHPRPAGAHRLPTGAYPQIEGPHGTAQTDPHHPDRGGHPADRNRR